MAALDGLTVLVPESRELNLFAAMLEQEGAATFRCPLVRILPLEDDSAVQDFIARCIDGAFDDLVLLTGEGLVHLVRIAGVREEAFLSALAKLRKIIRGPKPARALRSFGLAPDVSAPEPTSDSILDLLCAENIAGRKIAVQLYPGGGAAKLLQGLREGGAIVSDVTPYRYASDADTAQVKDAIEAVLRGKIGLIAFTATPQIERLFAVAKDFGVEAELRAGLSRTPIAAVGPVVQENLARFGLTPALAPSGTSFHMKPLVRAIMAWKIAQA